jgi:ABC-type lipoprotein export system ATPase subunit
MGRVSYRPVQAPSTHLIELREVVKTYTGAAGSFTALKGVDLNVSAAEFVAVIGKSGSGKSTLINMITGIDRPTSGEVWVNGTPVHALNEDQLARWRGRSMGIVFQFFQLLPTLTLLENVMLPMDLCGTYPGAQRVARGMHLLDQMGMADRADKLPAMVSGGQQQRVAIARALANDPPLIVADEPTGNLDSRTAEQVFQLFEELVAAGKTIMMVTHDNDLAHRADRAIMVADGEVVNQFVTQALATLDVDQLTQAARHLSARLFPPGATIVRQGDPADEVYIITRGQVDIVLEHPGGQQVVVRRMGAGQYFGEMAVLERGRRSATVRAGLDEEVEVAALEGDTFRALVSESEPTREAIERIIGQYVRR